MQALPQTFEFDAKPVARREAARSDIRAGFLLIALFFGGFGSWAALAPLDGAVVADAVVKVQGNRKSVENMNGGIVRALKVKEGDHVSAGDVLVALDDVQALANLDVLKQQQVLLQATQARLAAERQGTATVAFPSDLTTSSEPSTRAAIRSQQTEFQNWLAVSAGAKDVLSRQITGLNAEIEGERVQLAAYRQQAQSITGEEAGLTTLVQNRLVTNERLLELQRSLAGLQGQIGASEASIASAQSTIAVYEAQIRQVDFEAAKDVDKDLADVAQQLAEVTPKYQQALADFERMQIRAPYTGRVVGLSVFGQGAVISPGERILDIVPDDLPLAVEARVKVQDIGELHVGGAAEIHFTAYDQRTMPIIHGTIAQISADRLTDERTGAAYYVAMIEADAKDLARNPKLSLYPGMPATVMIATESRSALTYLVGPLLASFDEAFRQR